MYQLHRFALAIAMLLALAGCETTPAGPPDEELAMRAVDRFTAGLDSGRPASVGSVLSENFQHPEYGGKDDFIRTLEQFNDIGYFEDLMVSNTAIVRLEGETATVAPVGLEGTFGAVTIRFDLAKEAAGWRIVGLEMSGL